jgi:uncharacterized protein with HEPN domain
MPGRPMLPDAVRVRHMLDATRKALELAAPLGRSDLDTDEVIVLALTRLLEIVGEAGRHVSEPTRALAPAVPWREIAAARNRIIHGYFDVNLDTIWAILIDDLPVLAPELERLLHALD